MNEMLNEYLVKILEWLESGAMWLSEEIPLYIDELLKYQIVHNIILFIIYTIAATIPIIIGISWFKKARKNENSWQYDLNCENGWTFTFFLFGFFYIGSIYHLLDLFKILIAPRVWLINYISDFIS